jgi:hypothetical protein
MGMGVMKWGISTLLILAPLLTVQMHNTIRNINTFLFNILYNKYNYNLMYTDFFLNFHQEFTTPSKQGVQSRLEFSSLLSLPFSSVGKESLLLWIPGLQGSL